MKVPVPMIPAGGARASVAVALVLLLGVAIFARSTAATSNTTQQR